MVARGELSSELGPRVNGWIHLPAKLFLGRSQGGNDFGELFRILGMSEEVELLRSDQTVTDLEQVIRRERPLTFLARSDIYWWILSSAGLFFCVSALLVWRREGAASIERRAM